MPSEATIAEVRRCLELASYELTEDEIEILATCLERARLEAESWGCINSGQSVWPWLKNRMAEFDMLGECGGESMPDVRITCELHFPSWDEERYGPFLNEKELSFESLESTVARSPLSRLVDASPINSVARKIIQRGEQDCPYCKRYFRNPAALSLHVKDFHGEAVCQ